MEGYLNKRGRGRNFAFVKPWAQRYFILDTAQKELSYFIVEKGIKQKKGTININGCQIIETTIEKSGKPFSFEILSAQNTGKEESITLSAADDYTLLAWLNVLSLHGQNEVKWLPGRTPSVKESLTSKRESNDEAPHPSISALEEISLEGQLFKKSPISTAISSQIPVGGGGGIWVKRGFILDTEAKVLSFYNEVGARRCLVESFSVAPGSGSVQDALEASTGHPNSFILKCKGKSLASNGEVVVLAAMDADWKARLVAALCRALQCGIMPASSHSLNRVTTLSLVSPIEHTDGKSSPRCNSPAMDNTIILTDNAPQNNSIIGDNNLDLKSTVTETEKLTKLQVVERDRAARLKLQAETINKIQLEEERRKKEANESKLNDVLGKIQNRIKRDATQCLHAQSERRENNVSDRMVLAKKTVQKDFFPEEHLKTKVARMKNASNVTNRIKAPCEEDRESPLRQVCINPDVAMKIEVIKVLTPAKNMRKYLCIKELFSRSTAFVDFEVVREKILEFESDYSSMTEASVQQEDTFPYLPVSGCSLDDIGKYINHCEQRDAERGGSVAEVHILIGVTFDCIPYSRRLSCSLDSWAQDTLKKLQADPELNIFSVDDIILQTALKHKEKDVLCRTAEMLSRDELEIQKCHNLMVSPTKKSTLIQQVVRNHELRARAKASFPSTPEPMSPLSPSSVSPLLKEWKRSAPPPPAVPSSLPAEVISCVKKQEHAGGFVPPPPRSRLCADLRHAAAADDLLGSRVHPPRGPGPPLSGGMTAGKTIAVASTKMSSVEGKNDASDLGTTMCTSRLTEHSAVKSMMSEGQRSPKDVEVTLKHRPNTSLTSCYLSQSPYEIYGNENKTISPQKDAHDQVYDSFKRVIFKNKWCKNAIKRLSSMQKLKKILNRGKGCVGLICRCCPSVHLNLNGIGEKKRSAVNTGMSVLWLESIATKLGTFLPLSEREFLVEEMYAHDPDAESHVRWLSALLVSFHETDTLQRSLNE